MESNTDWLALWRHLSAVPFGGHREPDEEDVWRRRARRYRDQVRRRWSRPDSSREALLAMLGPGDTVLDIGAGTGAWTALLARHVRRVTAVEPSAGMREVLRETLAQEGLHNVDVVEGAWPEVDVGPHDVSLCAHAMYGVADLAEFVTRMERVTRRTCCLLMRVPQADGVMAKAATLIWGHPHDSPNFVVAYNALWQMGILADVLVEDTGLWRPWTHDSLDEALADVMRRFGLGEDDPRVGALRELLRSHLVVRPDGVEWPRGVRSALVRWPSRGAGGAEDG